MKAIALVMALCIGAGAYANEGDVNVSISKKHCCDDGASVIAEDVAEEKSESDFNIDFPFMPARHESNRDSRAGISFNIRCTMMLGFVGIVSGENTAKFQMGRSIEFYMPNIMQFKVSTGRNTPSVRLGAGFGLQHFFGKNGSAFAMEEGAEEPVLATGAFPDGSRRASSKINRFAITIPLMIDQKIGRSGSIALGAMLDFNTHLGATSKYKIDNSSREFYYGDLAMRPVTYEIVCALSANNVGMYFKYAPVNLFKKGCGPNTRNLSVGVVIGL